MVVFIFCCVLFVYNSIITKKVYVNPVKIESFLLCIKLIKKTIFIGVLGEFCDMATLSTLTATWTTFLDYKKELMGSK